MTLFKDIIKDFVTISNKSSHNDIYINMIFECILFKMITGYDVLVPSSDTKKNTIEITESMIKYNVEKINNNQLTKMINKIKEKTMKDFSTYVFIFEETRSLILKYVKCDTKNTLEKFIKKQNKTSNSSSTFLEISRGFLKDQL